MSDFPRGKGDPDFYGYPGEDRKKELEQAKTIIESFAPKGSVQHVVEPENGLWMDMTEDIDLPSELEENDSY